MYGNVVYKEKQSFRNLDLDFLPHFMKILLFRHHIQFHICKIRSKVFSDSLPTLQFNMFKGSHDNNYLILIFPKNQLFRQVFAFMLTSINNIANRSRCVSKRFNMNMKRNTSLSLIFCLVIFL